MNPPDEPATQSISALGLTFAPLFSQPVWEPAIVLVVGAILAAGQRTVSANLRVMQNFQKYHRVLSRAVWSSRHALSGVLILGE